MAKIPSEVGPKLPQIVVLFGATGDLAKRKPGWVREGSGDRMRRWFSRSDGSATLQKT